MPIAARWRRLEGLPLPRGRDPMPGVYELADEDKRILYIGQSALDVPGRIRQHLQKSACIRERVQYWRYAYSRVPQAQEAALLAAYRQKHAQLPPCNRAAPLARDALRRYRERSRPG